MRSAAINSKLRVQGSFDFVFRFASESECFAQDDNVTITPHRRIPGPIL